MQNGGEVLFGTLEGVKIGELVPSCVSLERNGMSLAHFRLCVALKGEEKNKAATATLENPCRSSRAHSCQLLVLTSSSSSLKMQPC